MDASTSYDGALVELTAGLKAMGLPRDRVCMLHVRLRGLRRSTGLEYADCVRLVLEVLGAFAPRALLVPAFTYSFVRSGVFHCLYSRAETGRFSEEILLHHARWRTPDPMFSVVDATDWLRGQDGLQFEEAFGPGSLWERLLDEDCIILNMDIEHMVSTQVHYLEHLRNAPWRADIRVPGVVYLDRTEHHAVDYVFFARDLEQNRLLDWPKIARTMKQDGVLRTGWAQGVKLAWTTTGELHACLGPRMDKDPYFPVAPKGPQAGPLGTAERTPPELDAKERE